MLASLDCPRLSNKGTRHQTDLPFCLGCQGRGEVRGGGVTLVIPAQRYSLIPQVRHMPVGILEQDVYPLPAPKLYVAKVTVFFFG